MVLECMVSNKGVEDGWTRVQVMSSERGKTMRGWTVNLYLFSFLKSPRTAALVISHRMSLLPVKYFFTMPNFTF